MIRSKAFRRIEEGKSKRKAKAFLMRALRDFDGEPMPDRRSIGRLAGCGLRPCSCLLCANPRKWGQLPLAERKSNEKMREAMIEYERIA